MENVELLLSDEFVKFSAKIAELHAEKKEKTASFKSVHEAWKNEMAELDKEAKEAQDEWEEWKQSHGAKK
ncbi:MAG: hypothetical protein M0R80_01925 [Proteobacteria bacterium]|jgi:hypothetical protein|nr:hypothetical protein [Pseudomonadota bacterium]